MHQLKERQRLILEFLLNKEFPVTVNYMAQQLHVSQRTIRYDLEALSYWMQANGLTLKKVPKKGIWVEDKEQIRQVLTDDVSVEEVRSYRILTPEERQHELIAILFSADDWISIGTLAEAVGISKSSCYSDMEGIRAWFEARHMTLINRPHVGYMIEATEECWRQGLIDYLQSSVSSQQLMNMVAIAKRDKKDRRFDFLRSRDYHDMFSEVDLERMMTFVDVLEERLDMRLLDSAYAALMIHIAIAIKRLREGEVIEMPKIQLEELRVFDAFEVVSEVLARMNFLKFEEIPQAEVGYITAHIIAARMRERKETYIALQHEKTEKTLTKSEKRMLGQILEAVTQHCHIHNPSGLKDELAMIVKEKREE